VIEILGFSSI